MSRWQWLGAMLLAAGLVAGCATGGGFPAAGGGSQPMPLLEQTPADPTGRALKARVELALAYLERGRIDVALAELEAARAVDAGHPLIPYAEGLIQLALGNEPAAIGHFQEALTRAPNDPDVLFSLGSLLCQRREFAQGLPLLQRAAEHLYYPRRGRAYANAAWCAWQSDEERQANAWLEAALALQPDDFLVQMRAVQWAVRQRAWEQAARHLVRLGQIAPDSPLYWWLAANVAHAKGDLRERQRWVERLQREAPDRPETRQAERGVWESW